MFSRKKNDPLVLSIDEERRAYFRVEPSPEKPVYLSIGPDRYQVKNIGAGGVAIFRRGEDKELELAKEYPFEMPLHLVDEVVSGVVRIIDISDRAYHCTFIGLTKEEMEKVHLFVLERQKEELKEKRKT